MGHAPPSTLPGRVPTPFTWLCFCSKLWTGLLSLGSGWGCPWDNPATSQGSLAPSSSPPPARSGASWIPSRAGALVPQLCKLLPEKSATVLSLTGAPSVLKQYPRVPLAAQSRGGGEGHPDSGCLRRPPREEVGVSDAWTGTPSQPGPLSPRCTPILRCPPRCQDPARPATAQCCVREHHPLGGWDHRTFGWSEGARD